MSDVCAKCNIVTSPSRRQRSPVLLLEAAASGRAVVAMDIPGNLAVGQPWGTGTFVRVGDANVLAEAVATLIDDVSLRTRIGQNGRNMAESRFDRGKINGWTPVLYAEACLPSPSRPRAADAQN